MTACCDWKRSLIEIDSFVKWLIKLPPTMGHDTERVRWGIIGCGGIATTAIAPAIRWSANGTLAAVASRSPERAQKKAAELGAPRAHGDYAALLADPEVDAVYIGLPNGLHARWASAALEAGKHVLCDKSLALSAADARAVRAAAAARGLRVIEGFMVRHHPQWDLVRRLLADGTIGAVRSLRAWLGGTLEAADDHRWTRELGGGALYDVTCYPVNAARLVVGEEPRRVLATGRWRSPGVDEATHALLEFPGGAVASVDGSLRGPPQQGVAITGERGRVILDRPFLPHWNPVDVVVEVDGARDVLPVPGANHFLHMIEHAGRLVRDPGAPAFPAEDGVANVTALEAIGRAAAGGGVAEVGS
jgi:predicted dehydrogenase